MAGIFDFLSSIMNPSAASGASAGGAGGMFGNLLSGAGLGGAAPGGMPPVMPGAANGVTPDALGMSMDPSNPMNKDSLRKMMIMQMLAKQGQGGGQPGAMNPAAMGGMPPGMFGGNPGAGMNPSSGMSSSMTMPMPTRKPLGSPY